MRMLWVCSVCVNVHVCVCCNSSNHLWPSPAEQSTSILSRWGDYQVNSEHLLMPLLHTATLWGRQLHHAECLVKMVKLHFPAHHSYVQYCYMVVTYFCFPSGVYCVIVWWVWSISILASMLLPVVMSQCINTPCSDVTMYQHPLQWCHNVSTPPAVMSQCINTPWPVQGNFQAISGLLFHTISEFHTIST